MLPKRNKYSSEQQSNLQCNDDHNTICVDDDPNVQAHTSCFPENQDQPSILQDSILHDFYLNTIFPKDDFFSDLHTSASNLSEQHEHKPSINGNIIDYYGYSRPFLHPDSIFRPSFGRIAYIGDLYDATTETFISMKRFRKYIF